MPKPSGRTNPEATEHTRRALLDAALDCIAEVGYASTSTTMIAKRAGVSRGAERHHFPAKADLMAATVDHLFARGIEDFGRQFSAFGPEERTFDRAVELLWTMFTDDSFRAGLELIVAGRTDPELGSVVHAAIETFRVDIARMTAKLFPGACSLPLAETAVVFAFAVVLGSSIFRQVGLTGYAEESLGVLRALALTTPTISDVAVIAEPG